MVLTLPFKQVDVFTEKPFKGNPVAVINCMDITDGEISDDQLQSIANWTNLSETTFIFKPSNPQCSYRIRIFTPVNELPLAGHPMVGTCKAFLEFSKTKDISKIYCECRLGVVELSIAKTGQISFVAPQADSEEISQEMIDAYRDCLHVEYAAEPKLLKVGPRWVVYLVSDAETCFKTNPDYANMKMFSKRFNHTGVILAGPREGSKTEFEMRAFAPGEGVDEDPVCGSGSLALTKYLHEYYQFSETTQISITEGGRIGREGHILTCISVGEQKPAYSTGGNAITIINGTISI